MDDAITSFFSKMSEVLPSYTILSQKICNEWPTVKIKIQKTQIAFLDKHNFAIVWLPIHNIKNRPDAYMILSFFLPYRSDSCRIIQAVEPYPGRWTHHVIISDNSEIDSEIMGFIKESYDFVHKQKTA